MEELLKQVNEYLESKISDVPRSTRDEIATFLVYRFAIHEADTIEKVNKEWKRALVNNRLDRLRRDIARTSVYSTDRKGESDGSGAL